MICVNKSKLIILASLLVAVICIYSYSIINSQAQRYTNTSKAAEHTITGGQNVEMGKYPWIALIETLKDGNTYRCTGFLVNQYWLLTAAHCVNNTDSISLTFNLIDQTTNHLLHRNGIQYIIHDEYALCDHTNTCEVDVPDIALVQLDKKVNISIPNISNNNLQLKALTVAGWGDTNNYNNNLSELGSITPVSVKQNDTMQEITLPYIKNALCSLSAGKIIKSDRFFCFGYPIKVISKNMIIEGGDSGSPVFNIRNNSIEYVGISTVKISSNLTLMSGAVKLVDFRDWINSIVLER